MALLAAGNCGFQNINQNKSADFTDVRGSFRRVGLRCSERAEARRGPKKGPAFIALLKPDFGKEVPMVPSRGELSSGDADSLKNLASRR